MKTETRQAIETDIGALFEEFAAIGQAANIEDEEVAVQFSDLFASVEKFWDRERTTTRRFARGFAGCVRTLRDFLASCHPENLENIPAHCTNPRA